MKSNKRIYLTILAILILGFCLRFFKVAENPPSMYWDETAIAYDAYMVAETGRDVHGETGLQAIFPSYGDYKLPLYIWLAAISVKIFGLSVEAVRLVSVLSGTAMILVVYGLSSELFKSRQIGLWSALMMAILPWSIHFSRIGFEAHVGSLMLSMAMLCLVKGIRKPVLFIVAGFLAGLAVYAYFSVRFVYPLILLTFVCLYFPRFQKRHWASLLVSGAVFLGLLLPIINSPLFEASNTYRYGTDSILNTDQHILDQNVNRELAGNGRVSRVLYHRFFFQTKELLSNVSSHLDAGYLFFWGDDNLRHGTQEVGLMTVVFIPIFVVGMFFSWKTSIKATVFLIAIWLAALIPASVPETVPHALRSLNALPVIGIVLGVGMNALFVTWMRKGQQWKFVVVLVLIGVSFIVYQHDYWTHYPLRAREAWTYDLTAGAKLLGEYYNSEGKVYITNKDDRLYWYVLFHLPIQAGETWGYSDNYRFEQFGNIWFVSIADGVIEQLNQKDVILMTAGEYDQLTQKPLILDDVKDVQGATIYYLASLPILNN